MVSGSPRTYWHIIGDHVGMVFKLCNSPFSHFHRNIIYHVCEAISDNFVLLAQNCLAQTLHYIVMQMRTTNVDDVRFVGFLPNVPRIFFNLRKNTSDFFNQRVL